MTFDWPWPVLCPHIMASGLPNQVRHMRNKRVDPMRMHNTASRQLAFDGLFAVTFTAIWHAACSTLC
jgi:hypothetical protein